MAAHGAGQTQDACDTSWWADDSQQDRSMSQRRHASSRINLVRLDFKFRRLCHAAKQCRVREKPCKFLRLLHLATYCNCCVSQLCSCQAELCMADTEPKKQSRSWSATLCSCTGLHCCAAHLAPGECSYTRRRHHDMDCITAPGKCTKLKWCCTLSTHSTLMSDSLMTCAARASLNTVSTPAGQHSQHSLRKLLFSLLSKSKISTRDSLCFTTYSHVDSLA